MGAPASRTTGTRARSPRPAGWRHRRHRQAAFVQQHGDRPVRPRPWRCDAALPSFGPGPKLVRVHDHELSDARSLAGPAHTHTHTHTHTAHGTRIPNTRTHTECFCARAPTDGHATAGKTRETDSGRRLENCWTSRTRRLVGWHVEDCSLHHVWECVRVRVCVCASGVCMSFLRTSETSCVSFAAAIARMHVRVRSCACVCIWIRVCICVGMHVCVYVCMHVRVRTC